MSYEKKYEINQEIVSGKLKKGYFFLEKRYEQRYEGNGILLQKLF